MPEYFGTVETGSNDWVQLDLLAGHTYYIELEGSASGGGTLSDPIVALWTAEYNVPEPGVSFYLPDDRLLVDDDGGFGYNSRLVFTPSQTQRFFVETWGYSSAAGTYRLRVFEDDFQNTVEGVGTIGSIDAQRLTANGTLNYLGDSDLYSTTMISGLTYTIDQRGAGSGSGTLGDPFLYLQLNDATMSAYDDNSGAGWDARITYTADRTGLQYIKAKAYADASAGSYQLSVSAGVATAGADGVTGTGASDAIDGAAGNDVILAGIGNDLLLGGQGNDALFGEQGLDTLRGQGGADTLRGGLTRDVLVGGFGADAFVFANDESQPLVRDTIAAGDGAIAFEGAGGAAGDRIDLSAIDADARLAGDQAFVLGGPGVGHLALVEAGGSTIVRANLDDDAYFEFELLIQDGAVAAGAYRVQDFVM